MKKCIIISLSRFVVLCSSACTTGKEEEKSPYDEQVVLQQATLLIDHIDQLDFESVVENSTKDIKALGIKTIQDAWETLGDTGKKKTMIEYEMMEQGGYAVIGIAMSFEHKDILFTISYDEKMQLAGLYFKAL